MKCSRLERVKDRILSPAHTLSKMCLLNPTKNWAGLYNSRVLNKKVLNPNSAQLASKLGIPSERRRTLHFSLQKMAGRCGSLSRSLLSTARSSIRSSSSSSTSLPRLRPSLPQRLHSRPPLLSSTRYSNFYPLFFFKF